MSEVAKNLESPSYPAAPLFLEPAPQQLEKSEATALPASTTSEPARSLLSPGLDLLFVGGAALFFYFFAGVFFGTGGLPPEGNWFVYKLAFFVNFPHFLASYLMLYGTFGKHMLTKPRFFWAGVLVPATLIIMLFTAITAQSVQALGYMVNAMFFFVGWHYVKQIFGIVIVNNALQKIYFTKLERWAVKANLIALWMVSWTGANRWAASHQFEGVPYTAFKLPEGTHQVALISAVLLSLAVVGLHAWKYVREGKKVTTPPAVASWLTIHIWYIPAFYHPGYSMLIPFFHSLQYFPFLIAFQRSKSKADAGSLETPSGRKKYLFGFYGFLLASFVLGAIFMFYLPNYLDSSNLLGTSNFLPTAMMAAFMVFINIHHYFIDNVLWRSDNPGMKQHLFG